MNTLLNSAGDPSDHQGENSTIMWVRSILEKVHSEQSTDRKVIPNYIATLLIKELRRDTTGAQMLVSMLGIDRDRHPKLLQEIAADFQKYVTAVVDDKTDSNAQYPWDKLISNPHQK